MKFKYMAFCLTFILVCSISSGATAIVLSSAATSGGTATDTYGITVNTTPSDAKVQILTIGPKYYPGIQVEPKQHTIKVSKAGYAPYRKNINVDEDITLNVTLKRAVRQAGDTFKDCSDCPQMVVIPEGRFQMGSNDRRDTEKPLHRVNIQSFSMSQTEVTKGQFAAFVDATGYRTDAEKNTASDGCITSEDIKWEWRSGRSWKSTGFDQNNRHPVVCVSYNDAKAYTKWLSQRTGKSYGLPSEAQWEYAARAGSTTKYHFGNTDSSLCRYGNVADKTESPTGSTWHNNAECADGYWFTAPVQNYQANDFGLYDMHGNVWEWTQDCWHDSYNNAPSDGRAWESANGGNCGWRVLRGGSWFDRPSYLRSAFRSWNTSLTRDYNSGFRLVQGG